MVSAKKTLLILATIFMVIPGAFVVNHSFESTFPGNPLTSTVYIENGVSGIVTITDPYLSKKSELKVDYYPLSSGSGVIITQEGYIITALHVIGEPKTSSEQNRAERMEKSDIINHLEKAAVKDYLSNFNPHLGDQLIKESSNKLRISKKQNLDSTVHLLKQNKLMETKSAKQVIKVRLPSSGGINSFYSYKARIVDVGDAKKNEDMALLKINPVKSLPTLKITSKKPLIGETLHIYGYPGNGGNRYLKNIVEPSSASGLLTSIKLNRAGTVYYQTTAATANGYSGGPVLNNQNQVVGIIIYGIERHSYFGKQFKSKSCLFLSSKHLIDMCKRNNVNIFV